MTTDPLDLGALRALLDKATPGPWEVCYSGPYYHFQVGSVNGIRICRTTDAMNFDAGPGARESNASLVAAAVSALPALLAELTRLRELEARVTWQPMETCPSEEAVLLYWPPIDGLPALMLVDYRGCAPCNPTRWMPLPAPEATP